jgi:hypothetical protein
MKGNLVHCYITGFKFDNIYGGKTDDYSRSITHMTYLDPVTAQKFPMIRNMWKLSDPMDTLTHWRKHKQKHSVFGPVADSRPRQSLEQRSAKYERTNSRTLVQGWGSL